MTQVSVPTELLAEIDALRKALEPFAAIGELIDREWWPETNGPLGVLDGHKLLGTLSSEDFRRAHAAHAKEPQP